MDLYTHTEKKLLDLNLLKKGARIVTAVSGGPDSMALFHVLHRLAEKWNMSLVAAHVNHRFRIEESAEEAALVKKFARKLGRPIEYAEIDLPKYIAKTGENGQAAARKKRYEFFYHVCAKVKSTTLMLAHHADDQAETIFMRLLKGASVNSLSGIPEIRVENGVTIARPLLDVNKRELIRYCRDCKIDYALDSSNESTEYFRNQVRLEIFPYLRKYQPQLTEALNRLGKIAALENEWIESEAKQFIDQYAERSAKRITWGRQDMLKLHPALQKRVIPLILKYLAPKELSYEYSTIESIFNAAGKETPPSVKLSLPAGLEFVREYDKLYVQVHDKNMNETAYEYEMSHFPMKLNIKEAGWNIEARVISDLDDQLRTDEEKTQLYLDIDQLEMPLTIRSRRPGDRMRIIGMNGTKKVKNIFIDEKVPPSNRKTVPILVDAKGELIWIAGLKYSGLAQPTRTSRNILHIISRPNIS